MYQKYLNLLALATLFVSHLSFAGGISSGGGTVGNKLEILAFVGQIDVSKGAVFIPDDKFIELIGIFGMKDEPDLKKSPISISQMITKDGLSALQGYNAKTDDYFVIFSDSQKLHIKNLDTTIYEMLNDQANVLVFSNN